MNQSEWQQSVNLNAMLEFVQGEAGDRKLRLFACACCRRIWPQLTDERSRRAVEVAERYADGAAGRQEIAAARAAARRAAAEAGGPAMAQTAAWYAARTALKYSVWDLAWYVAWYAARAATGRAGPWEAERREQAALLREILGDPFRVVAMPRAWPAPVAALARALYAGEDGRGRLADALSDAGYSVLADHFRTPDHPRGCWALDLILGKRPLRPARRRRGPRFPRASENN